MKTIRAMKTRTALLLVVALLLMGGTALAQTGGPAPWHTVPAGMAAGGSYHLTSLGWRVSGTAGGGSYSLAASDRAGGGNQCCCTYLPIVLRNK
ncbi:MAG: hypothetical protein KKA73_02030 [Chloroflexi bacterium]|nr:hypothetical protein [Chloroflexota bacterium]MBU1746445.1 hypothetical protein [Chloroflexota bacterium]